VKAEPPASPVAARAACTCPSEASTTCRRLPPGQLRILPLPEFPHPPEHCLVVRRLDGRRWRRGGAYPALAVPPPLPRHGRSAAGVGAACSAPVPSSAAALASSWDLGQAAQCSDLGAVVATPSTCSAGSSGASSAPAASSRTTATRWACAWAGSAGTIYAVYTYLNRNYCALHPL
jgi:hypothetical protein